MSEEQINEKKSPLPEQESAESASVVSEIGSPENNAVKASDKPVWKKLGIIAVILIAVSALRNLRNLTELHLSGNNISDVSALGNLTSLHGLNLYGNPIIDYSPVSFIENLAY